MAYTVNEIFSAGADFSCSDKGQNSQKKYNRTFQVLCDNPENDANAIAGAVITYGINKGSQYPTDSKSFCNSMQPECNSEDGCSWHVKVGYTPYPNGSTEDCPWLQNCEVSWSMQQFEKIVDKTSNNLPVVNSANEPFVPGLTIDQSRLILQVKQAEQTFDPLLALQYMDHVNSNTWLGFSARKVKCANISGSMVYDQVWGLYWNNTIEFHFNDLTWDRVVMDTGIYEIGHKTIIDERGNIVNNPVLLDGTGHKLADGGDPVWKTFKLYPEVSFPFSWRGYP